MSAGKRFIFSEKKSNQFFDLRVITDDEDERISRVFPALGVITVLGGMAVDVTTLLVAIASVSELQN